MGILAVGSHLHWNYFIALERDLEQVSRYVEFAEDNLAVYSIELAHLLFAAASEVDVVAKLLCRRLQPQRSCRNIDEYRTSLIGAWADLAGTALYVPRYGLVLRPFENWDGPTPTNPLWWRSYNNVKHERNAHFREATLKNAMNALGGLLILVQRHYSLELAVDGHPPLAAIDVNVQLQPQSTLIRFSNSQYYEPIVARPD